MRAPLTIEDMRVAAEARGGQCLSSTYWGNDVKLHWRCREGHEWYSVPRSIRSGVWCPVCAMERGK